MSIRTIPATKAEIATECFGDTSAPPILLIMGAMASMLWWPRCFCRALADNGFFVIRYDNRDTGQSTHYPPGEPGYKLCDMIDDALHVLDAYNIPAAHIVGMSLGGMIAQNLAVGQPDRVLSLTVISSSPLGVEEDLPPPSDRYMEHAATGKTVDWSDRQQVIDFMLAECEVITSRKHPFDKASTRQFIETDYDRARNFPSTTNHFSLFAEDFNLGRIADATCPTLVLHGTADPIFPIDHGRALAKAAYSARIIEIDGGGHELHPKDHQQIVTGITDHISQI